jgi:hypothetical protein
MQSVLLGISFALLSMILWPTPYALAQDTKVARGTVVALSGNSLTIKVRDQEMSFIVDPKTIVEARGAGTKARAAQASGKPGPKLEEVLKVGQNVAVTYNDVNGVRHASLVRAVTASSGGDGSRPKEPATQISIGTVQSIGANSITIAGSDNGATFTQTFLVDEDTRVVARGASTAAAAKGGRAPFSDLVASGDHVSVWYRSVEGRLLASDVRVMRKAMH